MNPAATVPTRRKDMSLTRLCALLCLGVLLSACATRPVAVVEKDQFILMARQMPKELQARRLLDNDGSYLAAFSLAGFSDYGEILFRRLSPSFLIADTAREVYPGENFAAALLPGSRVRHWPNGFSIEHPTQTLTVHMVAVADWNDDGQDEWIVSCLVEPKRGGRTRTYYVLVPPPRHEHEPLKGTPAAIYECFGLACSLYVRESKVIERATADPLSLPTEVQDVLPGLQAVTRPPAPNSPTGGNGGLEERNL